MAQANDDKKTKLAKGIILLQFIRSWTPYVKGEVAGFKKELADKLKKNNIAENYKK